MQLKKLINKSGLHKDIISFFIENPASIDTPRGISTWVKHDRSKVKKVLDALVESGVLIAHKATSTTGYSFTRNRRIISQIKKALKS